MMHSEVSATALWLMLLLGAYHGLNPAMGWLFAVALGMQRRQGCAVARSLVPIALGHALAVGSVAVIAAILGLSLPLVVMRSIVATLLVGLGIFFLLRHWHPRWVRMQVGFRDLTVWSFLMATAHGAGLMVVPVLLRGNTAQASGARAGDDLAHFTATTSAAAAIFATAIHTAGYLAVTGVIAWIVYRRVGLAVLGRAWFNVDLLWAVALVSTGVVTFLM